MCNHVVQNSANRLRLGDQAHRFAYENARVFGVAGMEGSPRAFLFDRVGRGLHQRGFVSMSLTARQTLQDGLCLGIDFSDDCSSWL
jgi:hypothetical protein